MLKKSSADNTSLESLKPYHNRVCMSLFNLLMSFYFLIFFDFTTIKTSLHELKKKDFYQMTIWFIFCTNSNMGWDVNLSIQ